MINTLVYSITTSGIVSEDFSNDLIGEGFSVDSSSPIQIAGVNYKKITGLIKDIPIPVSFYKLEDILAIIGDIPSGYDLAGPEVKGSNILGVLSQLLIKNGMSLRDDGSSIYLRKRKYFEFSLREITGTFSLGTKPYDFMKSIIGINFILVPYDLDILPLDYITLSGETRRVKSVEVSLVRDKLENNPYKQKQTGARKRVYF